MATATTPDQHTLTWSLGSLSRARERGRSAGECPCGLLLVVLVIVGRKFFECTLGYIRLPQLFAPSRSRTGFLFTPRPPRRCARLGTLIQFTVAPIYDFFFQCYTLSLPHPSLSLSFLLFHITALSVFRYLQTVATSLEAILRTALAKYWNLASPMNVKKSDLCLVIVF